MASYIRFDWAMKRLLRNKTDYVVIEGLLTSVLNTPVEIEEVVKSQPFETDDISECFRVDLLIRIKGELALVEIQNNNEYAYYQRTIFGLSEGITNLINNRGEGYEKVRKVYSVNIVYFSTFIIYHKNDMITSI